MRYWNLLIGAAAILVLGAGCSDEGQSRGQDEVGESASETEASGSGSSAGVGSNPSVTEEQPGRDESYLPDREPASEGVTTRSPVAASPAPNQESRRPEK